MSGNLEITEPEKVQGFIDLFKTQRVDTNRRFLLAVLQRIVNEDCLVRFRELGGLSLLSQWLLDSPGLIDIMLSSLTKFDGASHRSAIASSQPNLYTAVKAARSALEKTITSYPSAELNSFDALMVTWPKPLKSALRKRGRDSGDGEAPAKRAKTVASTAKRGVHWPVDDQDLCAFKFIESRKEMKKEMGKGGGGDSGKAEQANLRSDRYPGKERHPHAPPTAPTVLAEMKPEVAWRKPFDLLVPEDCKRKRKGTILPWGHLSTETKDQIEREKNCLSTHYFSAANIPEDPAACDPGPDYSDHPVRIIPSEEPKLAPSPAPAAAKPAGPPPPAMPEIIGGTDFASLLNAVEQAAPPAAPQAGPPDLESLLSNPTFLTSLELSSQTPSSSASGGQSSQATPIVHKPSSPPSSANNKVSSQDHLSSLSSRPRKGWGPRRPQEEGHPNTPKASGGQPRRPNGPPPHADNAARPPDARGGGPGGPGGPGRGGNWPPHGRPGWREGPSGYGNAPPMHPNRRRGGGPPDSHPPWQRGPPPGYGGPPGSWDGGGRGEWFGPPGPRGGDRRGPPRGPGGPGGRWGPEGPPRGGWGGVGNEAGNRGGQGHGPAPGGLRAAAMAARGRGGMPGPREGPPVGRGGPPGWGPRRGGQMQGGPQPGVPFKTVPCNFFMQGNCTKGPKCTFLHPGVD